MSDEMGVGFASYLTEKYYNAPSAIDVSIAIRNQDPILGLDTQYSTSPDYLFIDDATAKTFLNHERHEKHERNSNTF
jgi:hypothetical protein